MPERAHLIWTSGIDPEDHPIAIFENEPKMRVVLNEITIKVYDAMLAMSKKKNDEDASRQGDKILWTGKAKDTGGSVTLALRQYWGTMFVRLCEKKKGHIYLHDASRNI